MLTVMECPIVFRRLCPVIAQSFTSGGNACDTFTPNYTLLLGSKILQKSSCHLNYGIKYNN